MSLLGDHRGEETPIELDILLAQFMQKVVECPVGMPMLKMRQFMKQCVHSGSIRTEPGTIFGGPEAKIDGAAHASDPTPLKIVPGTLNVQGA